MPWKCNDMFFVYVVWLFSAKVFISNASWVKFPSKYQLSSDSAGLFPCSFGGIARWENTWKIPQKYQLNSEVRPFSLLFWLEFIKIPLKFHQNTTQILKNATKIPLKYQQNSTRIHRNNSGKHAVNLDKIGGSISMEFQWNSIKIPLWFHMFTSGMPPEFLRNTALKFQHFCQRDVLLPDQKSLSDCIFFVRYSAVSVL